MVADALSRKYEDVEAILCALSIIKPNWIIEVREEWKNGIMTHPCGHSFNSYKRILVYQILLCGRMIHYGIRITYISIRNPSSNKRCFWNYKPLR